MASGSFLACSVAATLGLAILVQAPEQAAATTILGSAASFAVLGASTVTNTGTTAIDGDVGVYPGSAITDTGITLFGSSSYQIDNAVAQAAQADAMTAFDRLAGLPSTANLTGKDLGGLTLLPGVYTYNSSAELTGTLTLDFEDLSNTDIVIQVGSTLTTASDSAVDVENEGTDDGVFFEVGSSATLGTGTVFAGNILAETSITLDTGAEILCGRAIALTGAVTMDGNTISNDCSSDNADSARSDNGSLGFSGPATPVPEPSTLALVGSAIMGLAGAALSRRAGFGSARRPG